LKLFTVESETNMPNFNHRFEDEDDYYQSALNYCEHGNPTHDCNECDAYINSRGDIDKCLNCGRYKFGDELNADQCCKKGCVNPNEY
jgi:hypothetical protein